MQEQNRWFWGVAVVAIAANLAGCSPSTKATTQTTAIAKPKVVASYSVLCDLTEKIAQDTVDLNCLIDADEDPHTYQATPEDRKAIETAQLVLYGGYDFEPTIINLIKATNNSAPKIAVDEKAVPNPLIGEEHHHDSKEKQTEAEKTPDPHVWHDAQNGIQMVDTIRDQLINITPANANLYTRNAQKLTEELKQVDSWIKVQINTIPAKQRKLVTTHDALGYYAKAYGLTVEGTLQGFSSEEQPTAARVKELVKEVKEARVPTIFAELTANDRVINTVAREAKVKVSERKLMADGLSEAGTPASTYIGMLTANTCAIVDGLGGKCTPVNFTP
ncbi:metal ABC transporter solute-binding protein, Zn/Mn family [Argonema antarcticum]|uniref:metal ABC transporter solute-binding protein, Zn/Mn family n=1 Tax=Argonema antarcticum TaxID=2942763 RepID=UPI002011786E|nr:zinc ABC transporter substrate-binding protein [Argonema antarcticum]MCL1469091.1 zinc ABC transporter substrate-binding protein [Argonema antarcticum A004/B2]